MNTPTINPYTDWQRWYEAADADIIYAQDTNIAYCSECGTALLTGEIETGMCESCWLRAGSGPASIPACPMCGAKATIHPTDMGDWTRQDIVCAACGHVEEDVLWL